MLDPFLVLITRQYNTIQALHPSLKWILKYFTADYHLYIPIRLLWRALRKQLQVGRDSSIMGGDHKTCRILVSCGWGPKKSQKGQVGMFTVIQLEDGA